MMNTVGVILNTASGPEELEKKITTLRQAFADHNIDAEFLLTHPGSDVKDVTQKAIAAGYQLIVVGGGDGTINAVASQLLDIDVCLGILPLGTFNHLAQDLNIPLTLPEAVGILANGVHRKIDVAEVNDQIFLNNSSIGLYPRLVQYRESHQENGWSKRFALLWALGSVFKSYSFLNVEIDVDGEPKLLKTPLAFVGNNKYLVEGLEMGKRERLDEGLLSVYVIKHSGKWDLLKLLIHSLFKSLYTHTQFENYYVKSVQFQTRKSILRVALDGEIVSLPSPLNYSIKPKALCVAVPNSSLIAM